MINKQNVINNIRNLSVKYKDKQIDGTSEYELQYDIEQLLFQTTKFHPTISQQLRENYSPVIVNNNGIFLPECWMNYLFGENNEN